MSHNLKTRVNIFKQMRRIGVKKMSKKRTKYTSTFKTKLALELLQNKSTLVQIASKHNILPQRE
jgi:transposase-like protein